MLCNSLTNSNERFYSLYFFTWRCFLLFKYGHNITIEDNEFLTRKEKDWVKMRFNSKNLWSKHMYSLKDPFACCMNVQCMYVCMYECM